MMTIYRSGNRTGKSAVLRAARRPAVATAGLALIVLAVASSYFVLHSPHATSTGTSAVATTATAATPHPTRAEVSRTPEGGAAEPSAGRSAPPSNPPSAKPKSGSKVVEWMLTYSPGEGEHDPQPGDPLDAYYAFTSRECGDLDHIVSRLAEPAKSLYEAAGAVCSTVFDGRRDLWTPAERSIAQVDGGSSDLNCYDRDVYKLVRRLVEAHRQSPDARIVAGRKAKTSTASCPIITKVVPNHGPMSGGRPVTVYGRNLPASVVVMFGTSAAPPARTRHGSEATVIAPACDQCDPTEPADGPLVVRGSWVTFFPGAGYSWDPIPASQRGTPTSPSAPPSS